MAFPVTRRCRKQLVHVGGGVGLSGSLRLGVFAGKRFVKGVSGMFATRMLTVRTCWNNVDRSRWGNTDALIENVR